MAEIIELGKANLRGLAHRVKGGEVFIYPTDTVYGLGCNALDESAVKRVFRIKGRSQKPLSVAFHDMAHLVRFVEVDEAQRKTMEEKLPGPYTFIVKNKKIPSVVSCGLETVGVRIPAYGPIRELIREADVPVVTTSANLAGGSPANSVYEIPYGLIDKVDFVIDAGKCGSGKPSTVIDLTTGETLR